MLTAFYNTFLIGNFLPPYCVDKHIMLQVQWQVKQKEQQHTAESYPKAVYTHCAAHVLNLCVVKCCNIPEVRNAMDIGDKFVGSLPFPPRDSWLLRSGSISCWKVNKGKN